MNISYLDGREAIFICQYGVGEIGTQRDEQRDRTDEQVRFNESLLD